ncbi:GNAT family N-acetyltransferase [Streptomyces zagrosensis]|uniref:N-acetyltransferase domain-containing protein n=1 Tax=Streptomyces zagrosensis TaxID=1042984 RepID=A0A7W9QJH0_9ACTN|nr:GNAT family N-acetyltransferase [Streptomyces zagrosensis]MBB5940147.1 hypothetical protein [Streptomyces zagrosensis]
MAEVFLRRLTRWQAEQQREAIADLYVMAYREVPGAVPAPGAEAGGSGGTSSGSSSSGRTSNGLAGGGPTGGGSPGGGYAGSGLAGSGVAGSGVADRAAPAPGRHDRRAFLERFEDHVGQPGFDMIIASSPALVGCVYGFQADRAHVWHPGFREGIPSDIDELTFSSPVFHLVELCVLSSRRRDHIATRLLNQLLTRSTGPLATAIVDANNLPAQRAFASWGWSHTGALLPSTDPPQAPPREVWSHRLGG